MGDGLHLCAGKRNNQGQDIEIVPLPKAPQDGMELLPPATVGGGGVRAKIPAQPVKFKAKSREEQPGGKFTWENA